MSQNGKKALAALFAGVLATIVALEYINWRGLHEVRTGIIGLLTGFLLYSPILRFMGGGNDDVGGHTIIVRQSYASAAYTERFKSLLQAGRTVADKEEVLHLERWHWRALLSDCSLPLIIDVVLAWGFYGFPGHPRSGADVKANSYSWVMAGGAGVAIALIWLARHGPLLWSHLHHSEAWLVFGKLLLAVVVWGLFLFPGLGLLKSLAEQPGSSGFYGRWFIVSAIWTLYMARRWMWGSFAVTTRRTIIAVIPPSALPADMKQISNGRVSQFNESQTLLGKRLGYGGLFAETDSDADRPFHSIWPLRHFRHANECIAGTNAA